jgi:hypothetical protein
VGSPLFCVTSAPVSQKDLELVVGLENQISALRAVLYERCAQITDRLLAGCPVEPGHQAAEIRRTERSGSVVFDLYLNGRKVK